MPDLRSRLTSCGSAAALGVALLTTTSSHHWTTSGPAYDTIQQDDSTGTRTSHTASKRPGSPAVTRAGFSQNEFHHFP